MKNGLLSLVLVGLLLVGCTTSPPSPELPPEMVSTPSPTPTVPPQPTPLPASDLTTLTLWVPDVLDGETRGEGHAVLLAQIEAFSRSHRNIQVQVLVKKAQGAGGLYDLLSTTYAAAPAVLPDLVVLSHSDLRTAADNGFILALPAGDPDTDVFPFDHEAVVFEERRYGLPFLSDVQQMVYVSRPDVAAPFSWTTVLTGGYSLLFPIAPTSALADDFLLGTYLGSGGQVMDEEGRSLLDRPHLEEIYRFITVMIEAELVDPARLSTLPNAVACWEAFQQGAGLLSVVPAGLYWTHDREGTPAWTPTREGQPFALAQVWTLAVVSTEPAHEEAALQLARWLSARGPVADLSAAVGMLPPSREALALWPLAVEDAAFLEQLLSSAVLPPPRNVDQAVRRALQAGLDFLLTTEGGTPEQAATHALTVLRR